MILQRDRPIHVWGTADPGESITVNLEGTSTKTATNELGTWSVYLPAHAAGGPFELSVEGKDRLTFHNVLIGDVWVASGQSNMEFKVRQGDNAKQEIGAANYPTIRFLRVERKTSAYPLDDVDSDGWHPCTPDIVGEVTAVGYFFARDVQKQTHVPIGIIDNSWGGTPLAAFTSMTAIGKDSSLMPQFAAWGHMMEHEGTTLLTIDKEKRDFEAAVQKAKAAGQPVPAATWHATPEAWSPAAIYNGMVAPVTHYAIAGVIWYQGESDADAERAGTYARLFRTMITDWRSQWEVGEFPFLYVQLPNYNAGAGNAWPELREAQLETLQVKNTGMAIILDLGIPDNIHPTHKQEVGRRLSLLARAMTLGEHIEDEGPLFRTALRDGSGVRLWLDHAGGLSAKGGAPQTFEVAGSDGKYVPAKAVIQGESVYLSAEAIASPQFVRYAWNANPTEANLYNGNGLPASPFRSAVKQ